MAKARAKPRTKAVPPPPPAPEPVAPVVEEESDPVSRGTILATVGVVVASLAATILLLSGWTPGPGTPAPKRVAARTPASATNVAPKKAAPKVKKVKAKPRKRAAAGPPSTRLVSKRLFQEDCGFCHTLAAAGAKGRVGPNLDKLRPGRQRVLDAIAAGGRRTGLMPPDILTGSDALNLATFVAEATRR